MKIKTIFYERVFPIAPYVNEKIGAEATLEDDDNPSDCLAILKETVEMWHKQNETKINETQSQQGFQPPENPATAPTEKPAERPKDQVAGIIFDIASVTDLKVLDSYKLVIKKHPDIQAAYEKKYSELYIQSTT
jgi:hypothetical protein